MLESKKYTVDYFQREYNWQKRHIEQLITDLTCSFLNEYRDGDNRNEGENYNNYYLGPFVVSEKGGQRSIIDGQQRLTSLTLLLIFLNNLQKSLGIAEKIEPMIFSEHRGTKSFNIQLDERRECLDRLFQTSTYVTKESDDPSTVNMADRYSDIVELFPEEIRDETILPYFIDWVKYNVIMVEIIAYSDDNAYTIFETMNDRGLNLTPTEMLKGFILSRLDQPAKRTKANDDWKKAMQSLGEFEKDEDQRFFQAWLRACYADTIRPGKAGSQNEDFEKIGTRFHSWVRDNLSKIGLDPEKAADFERFVAQDFKFYLSAYLRILRAQITLSPRVGTHLLHCSMGYRCFAKLSLDARTFGGVGFAGDSDCQDGPGGSLHRSVCCAPFCQFPEVLRQFDTLHHVFPREGNSGEGYYYSQGHTCSEVKCDGGRMGRI